MDVKRIANKLLELRDGRPRSEVAQACGISVSAVAMYEQGMRVPKDDIKIKLAKYYGVPVESIFYV